MKKKLLYTWAATIFVLAIAKDYTSYKEVLSQIGAVLAVGFVLFTFIDVFRKQKKEDIFDKDYLQTLELKFKVTKDDGQYGEAFCKNNMTQLNWNRRGHTCTYFGVKLEPNVALSIRKDGGTRSVFNGYIFDREQLELLLKLTM